MIVCKFGEQKRREALFLVSPDLRGEGYLPVTQSLLEKVKPTFPVL